jgi:peptidoglycan/xylan/chitin deacetylase (PgdA/CDA1 family)
MYHRVAEHTNGVDAPTLNVTPSQFRRQIAGLIDRGFECWPLSKLVAAHSESQPLPSNAFAITFDDGYENNYTHAWPIIRELNVAGTIFLSTQYLDSDQPFPFDAWSEAGSHRVPASAWQPLTTAQCKEMLASGDIELGAHTHSHCRFTGRTADFIADMQLCLGTLRDHFGVIRPTFAFPYGEFNSELVAAARGLDLSCAVTVRERRVQPGDDVFEWGRLHVGQHDTPAMLAGKLSGWYSSFVVAGKALVRARPATSRVVQQPTPQDSAIALT